MLRIGLVMLQGARHAHLYALKEAAKDLQIEVEIFELRNKNDLLQCNPQAIVLPGGESTTMRLVGNSLNSQLLPALFQLMRENSNLPVLGTCAGAILLSDPQDNGEKIVDANISRNAFGNQSESFQSVINSPLLSRDFPGIFSVVLECVETDLAKEISNKVKEDFDNKKLPLMLAMINAIVEDKKLELDWEAFR